MIIYTSELLDLRCSELRIDVVDACSEAHGDGVTPALRILRDEAE
jgi:hypothetical protein